MRNKVVSRNLTLHQFKQTDYVPFKYNSPRAEARPLALALLVVIAWKVKEVLVKTQVHLSPLPHI